MTQNDFTPQYVETPVGRMHVVTRGAGPDFVLLHQTPRSWDEHRPLMQKLEGYRLIAPDLPGHGSSAPPGENTIRAASLAVLAVMDALGTGTAHLLGHHFGGLVAYDLASIAPDRVNSLTLSSTPFIDAAERTARIGAPPLNAVQPRAGGGHLTDLWARRSTYLAEEDPAVLSRYVRDVLSRPDPDRGHEAVAAYRSEDGVGAYRGPVLCVSSAKDPRAFPQRERIHAAFPGADRVVLAEGDIAAPERCPDDLAAAVAAFHRTLARS